MFKPSPIVLLDKTGGYTDPYNAAAFQITATVRGHLFFRFIQGGTETTTLELQCRANDGSSWGTIHTPISVAAGANTGTWYPSSGTVPDAHYVLSPGWVRARLNFTGSPTGDTHAIVEFHPLVG